VRPIKARTILYNLYNSVAIVVKAATGLRATVLDWRWPSHLQCQ
jgi:hypothetical protein